MPMLRTVEAKITMQEGFEIDFITMDGQNVRGDKTDIPQWSYQRQSKNDMTVAEWKRKFHQNYPGYDVIVYDGYGQPAMGQMKLGTLRDTYNPD